jgi:hypothetical protein
MGLSPNTVGVTLTKARTKRAAASASSSSASGTRLLRDAQVYLHQGLLGTPSQGLGIVGRFAVGRGRMITFVVIIG